MSPIDEAQVGHRRAGQHRPPLVTAVRCRKKVEARLADLARGGPISFEEPSRRCVDELNLFESGTACRCECHDAQACPCAAAVSRSVEDVAASWNVGRRCLIASILKASAGEAEHPTIPFIDELEFGHIRDVGRERELGPRSATVHRVEERSRIGPPGGNPAELASDKGLRHHLEAPVWVRRRNFQRAVTRDRIDTHDKALARNSRSLRDRDHELRLAPLRAGEAGGAHAPALAGKRGIERSARVGVFRLAAVEAPPLRADRRDLALRRRAEWDVRSWRDRRRRRYRWRGRW